MLPAPRRHLLALALAIAVVASPRPGTVRAQGLPADDPAPEVVFAWSVPGSAAPRRIIAADGRAFVLLRAGSGPDLHAIEVLDRTEPTGGPGGHDAIRIGGRARDLTLVRSRTFDPVTSLHAIHELLLVAGGSNAAEIAVVSAPAGGPMAFVRSIDLPGTADALAITSVGERLYVGRARSPRDAELVVLDASGEILGSLDLPDAIDEVEVAGDELRASSRRRTFTIDVADPARPRLLATTLRAATPAPPLQVPLTTDFAVDGPMAYLAVKKNGREVQQVRLPRSFAFDDVDGDGRWSVGCVGDSNTTLHPGLTRWCEKLVELVDDPRFAVVNFAVSGATAIPSGVPGAAQVAAALDPQLAIDAVVVSLGTNDTNLVHFASDPARFESQLDAITEHLAAHVASIEASGRTAYVATLPPRPRALYGPDGFNERIVALNERIRATSAPGAVIEHYDFFYADERELLDGVHLNQRGQDKRAWRALQVLLR